ncbi:sensor histidine kinase [Salmonella enterica]|nr:sensor histidine kinase [Salmonella enterica]
MNKDFCFILEKSGEKIIDNVSPDYKDVLLSLPKTDNLNSIINESKKTRAVIIKRGDYKVLLLSTNKDHIKSKLVAKSDAENIINRAKHIDESIKQEKLNIRTNFSRFTHNIKTLCTMSIQDIDYFSPTGSTEDIQSSKLKNLRLFKEELELADIAELAKAMMRIYKNMQHIENDITVYDYLFNGIPLNKKIRDHSVHKVITRSVLCCASILYEKGVTIKLGDASWPIKVDYTSTQVALFYIMDNIIKYIKPDSELVIDFEQNKPEKTTVVTFKMHSLYVKKSEQDKIFDEGYSGHFASKCHMSGKGLGMYTARKILEENNAKVRFIASDDEISNFLDRKYAQNKVKITFSHILV